MKKLLLVLGLFIIVFSGCKKDEPVHLTEINAHILDGGNNNYYIKLDSTQESILALNLPSEFKTQGANTPVAVKFVETGKTTSTYRVVYITGIRKL